MVLRIRHSKFDTYTNGNHEMEFEDLTRQIISFAVRVHNELGPGLLESAYRRCLIHELSDANLFNEVEVPIPVSYRGVRLDCGYRADIIVAKSVLLELKAIDSLLPIHKAQVVTYLRLSGIRVGLLINFNELRLVDGVRRLALR